MGQLIGCGALLITLGVFGLIISYFGVTEGSSRRAVWRVFEIFSEMVGSMPIASGLFIAFGVALVLVAFGYEEHKKEKLEE